MMPTGLNARRVMLAGIVFGSFFLSACNRDEDELEKWMVSQRENMKPSVEPIAPPKRFLPQAYDVSDRLDPFDSQKLKSVLDKGKHPCSLLLAEQTRRRESLEAFPLDSITMVGSYVKKGQQFALLSVSGHLYSAKVGDYLGQNYGKIMRVTESEVSLREIGQDPAGECEERAGTLQLQEKSR